MAIRYNFPKTLGPKAARLISRLYEEGRTIFTLREAASLLSGRPDTARRLVDRLVVRGLATRLKAGLFELVPFELGDAREYIGNPYLVARAIAGNDEYYISHGSAMDLHQMLTQPQLIVYVTTLRPLRSRVVFGAEIRFVRCQPGHFFGTTEHWIEKSEKVVVSDLERTVIDGLTNPSYCGGIAEVAKGFWIRRSDAQPDRLLEYAFRLNLGSVIRRLGFLMELYGVGSPVHFDRLREKLTHTYHLLDPVLPREGKFVERWRLQLNVTPEELKAITRT